MVKHTSLEASLRGVTIPEMWSLVGPPEAFIAYHREWHHNDKIKVAEWSRIEADEGKDIEADTTLTRHVYFMLPLDAPSWFRKAIGLDAVPVLDDQEVTTYKNGNLLLVLRPRLRTPSHERFPHVQVATLEWFFSHEWDTDGTIISKGVVTVTASAADLPGWLWALKPTIERVMIWQASKSARAFLTFCQNRAAQYVAEGKARTGDAAASLGSGTVQWATPDILETAYFDPEDFLDLDSELGAEGNELLEVGSPVMPKEEPAKSVTLKATAGGACSDTCHVRPPPVETCDSRTVQLRLEQELQQNPPKISSRNKKVPAKLSLPRFVACLSPGGLATVD